MVGIEELLKETCGEINGLDTEDNEYESILDLWNTVVQKNQFYSTAFNFWENESNCPLSDDGVLGGYGKLTPADVQGSNLFLDSLLAIRPELKLDIAADCGAGIGRVSKHFLLLRFSHVHLIEQSPRLLSNSQSYIGEDSSRTSCIVQGLQDFSPEINSYDVIWIQWVIGHLQDIDFINFFRRCVKGLRPGGVVILKDNCCESWTFVLDRSDSSLTRSRDYMHLLFKLSGLSILKETKQENFPSELYPVYMTALTDGGGCGGGRTDR